MIFMGGCEPESLARRTLLDHSDTIHGLAQQEFRIEAERGDRLRLTLAQDGLDLYLAVQGPDGASLGRFESSTGRYGEEAALVTAPVTGTYVVRVASDRLPHVTGSYRLSVVANESSTEVFGLYSSATNAESLLTPEQRIELLSSAAAQSAKQERWRQSGMAALAAASLVTHRLSDAEHAQELLGLARRAFTQSNDALPLAAATNLSASLRAETSLSATDGFKEMEADFRQARRIYEVHGSAIGAAEVDLYRGVALYRTVDSDGNSRRDESVEAWKRVEAACRELRESGCEALALMNLGVYHRDSGDLRSAFENFYRSSALVTLHSEPETFADVHDNLGFALSSVWNFDAAMHHHELAMRAYAEHGECSGVSRSLYGIGYALLGIGDIEQASRFYNLVLQRRCNGSSASMTVDPGDAQHRSSSLREMCQVASGMEDRDKEERLNLLWTAWDLGNSARARGDYEGAMACHGLAIRLAPTEVSRYGAQLEHVEDLLQAGKSDRAVETFVPLDPDRSGALTQSMAPLYLAKANELAGRLSALRGDGTAAERSFADADRRYGALENFQGQFEVALARALLAREADATGRADAHFDRADALLDKIRLSSIDPTYRSVLFASRRRMYETWVESIDGSTLATDRHDRDLRALVLSERSRSRVLADLINAYEMGKEARSAQQLFSPSARVTEILATAEDSGAVSRSGPSDGPEDSYRYGSAASTGTNPSDLRVTGPELEAWRKLLRPSTTVVEYMLGDKASHAWILRTDALVRVQLPHPSQINSAASDVHAAMTAAVGREDADRSLSRLHDLIIEPLQPHLQGTELMIVADGSLYNIPFAALLNHRTGRYLIEGFSVRYLPSAQFAMRRSPDSRTGGRALLVGDPVYDVSDAERRCAAEKTLALEESASVRPAGLRRLRGTGTEVSRLVSMLTSQGMRVDVLTGCEASRSRVLAGDLNKYRYLHFATHATVDARLPQHSAIHLAAYDSHARRIESELSAADLFEIPLNAELVVFSGCSTGGGRSIEGEGVLGLSFAALARGGRNVLSTLWPVADVPSATIMQRFYTEMTEGTAVPDALRAAQLAAKNDPRWASPRHWAAYVLVGA